MPLKKSLAMIPVPKEPRLEDYMEEEIGMVKAYRNLLDLLIQDMSCVEEGVIAHPLQGNARSKRYYANKCRELISLLVTNYYSIENKNKWIEFKEEIKTKMIEKPKLTQEIMNNDAINYTLNLMARMEKDYM